MNTEKHDIVYLYKDKGTDALRYSLRSLVNVPHDRVIIVGDRPRWLTGVKHIPYKFGPIKILNEWGQILKACKEVESFLLFNDDFFILQPLESFCFIKGGLRKRRPSPYYKAYLKTEKLFKDFKNYEVHAPMLFESDKLLKLQNEYNISRGGYLHRSLYGNHYKCAGVMVADNKVRRLQGLAAAFSRPFVSTTDEIEKHELFKKQIRKAYATPSQYEADNSIH